MYDQSPPPKHFQQLAKRLPFTLAKLFNNIPDGTSQKDLSFKELPCSEQDRAKIFEIVTTVAENNKGVLLLKQGYLENLGAQIIHVHPLKFLATIFSHPRLKGCMSDIFDDYFKRTNFMDGLGAQLSREAMKGNLNRHLADFAAEIQIPPEKIKDYFQSREWEEMVRFFIHL